MRRAVRAAVALAVAVAFASSSVAWAQRQTPWAFSPWVVSPIAARDALRVECAEALTDGKASWEAYISIPERLAVRDGHPKCGDWARISAYPDGPAFSAVIVGYTRGAEGDHVALNALALDNVRQQHVTPSPSAAGAAVPRATRQSLTTTAATPTVAWRAAFPDPNWGDTVVNCQDANNAWIRECTGVREKKSVVARGGEALPRASS